MNASFKVHTIRLHGPWIVSLDRAKSGNELLDRRIRVPFQSIDLSDVDLSDVSHVGLLRRFGCPTNLKPQDQVQLVIESEPLPDSVVLNGQSMPITSDKGASNNFQRQQQWRIENDLQARNELFLSYRWSNQATSDQPEAISKQAPCVELLISEVRLEIHAFEQV